MDISELKKDVKADETRIVGAAKTEVTSIWSRYRKQILIAGGVLALILIVVIAKHV